MTTAQDEKLLELKEFIDGIRDRRHAESYLIAVLHKTQQLYRYLPREAMDFIADEMNIPTAHIWGVATFYHYFNLEPPGKYTVSVCLGTACYVKGANDVLEALKKELGTEVGSVSEDRLFSLEGARCLGACGLAPVIMIDDKIYGDLTPAKVVEIVRDYRKKNQNE